MTVYENLMVTAMEECAEIQKEISKALRFGINNHHPDEPEITNGGEDFNRVSAITGGDK